MKMSEFFYINLFYSSLVDEEGNLEVIPDHAPITYHLEEEASLRGKKKLITSDGFSFTVKEKIDCLNEHLIFFSKFK